MKKIILTMALSLFLLSTSYAEQVTLYERPSLQPVSVTVDKDHAIFVFASWCPYCKKLEQFMSDPKVKTYLQDKSFSFVVYPEWQTIEAKLAKTGKSDKLEQLKAESGDPDLFKPEIVKNLPGPAYFCDQKMLNTIEGFPSAYSVAEAGFKVSARRWFELNTKIPKNLLDSYFLD